MNVVLVTPWDNVWVPMFKKAALARGATFSVVKESSPQYIKGDLENTVVIHGWAVANPVPKARNICFLRRFELFSGALKQCNWAGMDEVIVVNSWIGAVVKRFFERNEIETPLHCIYNSVDPDQWSLVQVKEEVGPIRLGMACYVHPKKNLPLALYILNELPKGSELHIAGGIQDVCTAEYLNHLAAVMKRQVFYYGQLPHDLMNEWWDDKTHCLSTSLSEGNPNNVLEAAAKGVPPVIHNWPGASDQFPDEWLFSSIARAVQLIKEPAEDLSSMWKKSRRDATARIIRERFGPQNIERVLDVALGVNDEKSAKDVA